MDNSNSLPKLIVPIVGMFAFGTLGYMLLEDWSLLDSLYMTVTTLTTVGYGEVKPLDTAGKIFTCILILSGVGTATYCFSRIIALVVEGEIAKKRLKKRMEKDLLGLKDHVIVCGYGRLGQIVTKEIVEAKQKVVVIDTHDHSHLSLNTTNIMFIQGSAYDDDILKRAGVEHA